MEKEQKIRVLLVDDEILALDLVENFIARLSSMEIVGRVQSSIEALEILQLQTVDLLFLDIQMPTLSGTDLLKLIPKPPVTIFTTAYSEYAPLAFDLNAVDYLLKPFAFERFLQAVSKAKQQLNIHYPQAQLQLDRQEKIAVSPLEDLSFRKDFIAVKVDGNIQKIYLKDIIYIEGMREYVQIVCEDKKKFTTLESLKNMESKLSDQYFMRVHKSYIAAKAKATKLIGNMLEIGAFRIPISRRKKEQIIQEIFS